MRLCLVGAILAIFISIKFQSEQYWLFVLLIFSVLLGARLSPWSTRFFAVLCLLASAYYSHYWLEQRLSSRLSANLSGITVEGVGDIVGCSDGDFDVQKLLLQVEWLNANEQILPPLKRLALSNYQRSDRDKTQRSATIACGSKVKFTAKLRAPYSFVNPWGFDYEAWQLSRGVDASGYFLNHEVIGSAQGWQNSLLVLRQQWIQRAASLSGPAGQLVPALLFGESGYLPKDQWLDFQLTGTIHLLIVSGLHVGFLVFIIGALWFVLIRLEVLLFFPKASLLFKLTPVVLLLACGVYAYMAGMGLAIQRAGLMLAMGIGVVYLRRHWSLFDTWLWVVLLVLLINPLSMLFIGFWFSFAAVGALLIAYVGQIGGRPSLDRADSRRIKKTAGQSSQIIEKLKLVYHPQWVVFIALMPLLWMFQQPQSVLSFFTNIIAIPLLGFIVMPLSLLAFIWPESMAVDALNSVLSHAMVFLHQLSNMPSWLVYKSSGLWLILLLPLVLLALWFTGAPFKRLSIVLLTLIFFLPLTPNEERLIVFDVGQGLAVYGSGISNGLHDASGKAQQSSWLYDTGAQFRSGFSLGDAVVAKNILAFNGQRLDLLFVSHSDNDHAGGEDGLRRKLIANSTFAGQPKQSHHKNCHDVDGWQTLSHGAGRWRLFKYATNNGTDNNQSCVIQIEMSGKTILLPGDIDKKAEALLLAAYGNELKSDVLVVGHHGSKTSSSDAWLASVDPTVAIVSSGFNNRFHHPHGSVLARFQRHSIALYNTADSGAVEIHLAKDMQVTQWRKKNAPVWRQN